MKRNRCCMYLPLLLRDSDVSHNPCGWELKLHKESLQKGHDLAFSSQFEAGGEFVDEACLLLSTLQVHAPSQRPACENVPIHPQ